ncbi:MAG: EAL domain-containing protein [Pseudomonadota bacterium]
MSEIALLPRSWRSVTLIGGATFLVALAGLYFRAEAVDPRQHFAYAQQLRDLRELDARIDGELLANRLEFTRNYDALTRYTAAAQARVALVDDPPAYLAAASRASVRSAAAALADSIARKAGLVDSFKRNDAVLRNSLAYFPLAAANLLDVAQVPPLPAATRPRIGNYVRSLLAFARLPDESAAAAVRRARDQLDAMPFAPAHRPLVDNLRRHGEVVLARLTELDRQMADVFALPTGSRLEALNQAYGQGHGRALEQAELYRFFLYALVVALSLFLAWTFARLERARRSLETAHREVSQRYAAQLAAEKQLKLHATAFRNAHDGITLTDADGNILDINPAFTRITGYERSEVIGRNPRVLKSGRHERDFYAAMWKSITETGSWRGEIWNRNKYGEVYPELLSISAVRDEASGQLTNYVAVFADIGRLKAQEQQLSMMAYYDALTELPNRALLADRLVQAIAQTRRTGTLMAICYLDLDGFKPINDTWGHDAGDRVLVEIANRLKDGLRGGDTVARLGGDEFVLLLLGLSDADECDTAMQRLLGEIARPLTLLPDPVTVSGSIGLALFPHDDSDPDTLLRHADQAMYAAKQAGKNCYHLFDAEEDRSVRTRHNRVERIRQALENHELELYFQPKVNMRKGVVFGAEALIRWNHPELGVLPPIEFLPLIEDDELIKAIGDWVIEAALTQMDHWHAQGLDLAVSVNVAARQLQAPEFVEKLKVALFLHPDVAPRLELEVLETAALEDVVQTSRVIEECRALGVRFALDDFGTGYSSLTYLKRLPTETIKIDQSFVREILSDHNNLVIVQSVVGLASAFQRGAIAEGVETVEHGRLLMQLNCDLAQGYGIARPMPADQLPDWVRGWRPDPSWQAIRDLYWQDSDYPMFIAEVEHRNWIAQLVYAVNEGQPVSRAHLVDVQHCRFGQWYEGNGRMRYAKLPAYARIEAPHRQVHEMARRIDRLWRDGQADDARALIPELLTARDEVLAALLELQQATGQPRNAH